MALEDFFPPGVLNPDSDKLHHYLKALRGAEVMLPRDGLLQLITQLGEFLDRGHNLGEALHSLGRHQMLEDRSVLRAYMEHEDKPVVLGACEGLIASHGLGSHSHLYLSKDRSALSPHHRLYRAVFGCHYGREGGYYEYFRDRCGDDWKLALEGFEAMGMIEKPALLLEAASYFGPEGPSECRETRLSQLASMDFDADWHMEALAFQYNDSKEITEVFATRYVLENIDSFR